MTDVYLANVLQLEEYKRRRLELEQRFSLKDGSRATFEQKRQLSELFIDRVVVTGEEVEIRRPFSLSWVSISGVKPDKSQVIGPTECANAPAGFGVLQEK